MSVVDTLLRAVLYIARAVRAEAEDLFVPELRIRIVHSDDRLLVLDFRGRELTLDRRFGTVKSGSRVVTRFGAIRAIVVRSTPVRQYEAPLWTVTLSLGWFSRVLVGRTHDDAEASIVAARLTTLTGKPVEAR